MRFASTPIGLPLSSGPLGFLPPLGLVMSSEEGRLLEAAAIDEGLQAIEGVAMLRDPIGLDSPRDPREDMTGQVRNPDPGQDEKSGVVNVGDP